MPNFLRKLVGITDDETIIWHCEPLLVVQSEKGVVYAASAEVELVADDKSERSGLLRVIRPPKNGLLPHLRFRERIETFANYDVRFRPRPGLILVGEDESGEPCTWYVNGEADRYLTNPPNPSTT